MKKGLILLFLLLLALPLHIASAEIIVSQPNTIYNLGDVLEFNVNLQPQESRNDFALASVVCGENEIEVFRNPVSMSAGESRSVDVSFPLTKSIIGSVSGNCVIKAKYGPETTESAGFKISNKIDLQLNLNAAQYSPGNLVIITGKALKENGVAVEGFVKIKLANSNSTLVFPISQGNINANFSLAADAAPGDLNLEAEIYEKDSNGDVTNSGTTTKKIKVKQIVKSINIGLEALEVTPGAPLDYKITAVDQTGTEILKEIVITISRPDGSQYSSESVRTGNTDYLLFPTNVEFGVWAITANLEGLTESKTFSMPEIQRAKFDFLNDTLVITNIGNVPYVKSVGVTIGDKTISKQLNLAVNASKVFKLLAPSANYQVKVSDGYTKADAFSVPLTGRAIDLGEVRSFSGSIIPAIVIIFALVVLYIFLKVRKFRMREAMTSPKSFSEYSRSTSLVKATISQEASMEDGSRETGAIIALKLPQYSSPSTFKDMLSALKHKAMSKKAHAETRGNFMLFLLTSKLSGQDYEIEAVKLAQEIQKIIKSAVSSANVHAPSSIGITKGEVITSGSLGRLFSFTALGNAVSKAQKLASQANGEILVADAIKARAGTQARFSRFPGTEAWKVDNVVNRDEYAGFVSGFIKRHGKK